MKFRPLVISMIILLVAVTAVFQSSQMPLLAQEQDPSAWLKMQRLILAGRQNNSAPAPESAPAKLTHCIHGLAGPYPCAYIDLLAQLDLEDLDAQDGNDIWGWTDPASGREFALVGLNNGVAFVDISDPVNPQYLGKLPTHTVDSLWRDIKVYADHAFVVSEAPEHGLQIFNLKELLAVSNPPQTFIETTHYDAFGRAHNIAINEESGFAYVVGTMDTCSGGLHMINIQDPANPTFAGCFSQDGYTHDTQCVIYRGPDQRYQGGEICINSNEDTLTIVDVTNKENPVQVARKGYPGASYTHQGWLTEDQRYFLLGDELDEIENGNNTRTYIWDLADLQEPKVIGTYTAATPAIDHNLYIQNGLVYEANYRSGLRILDGALISHGRLQQLAYFDTYPTNNSANFNGAWSVYPFFTSGNIIVSDIDRGLFVLRYSPPDQAYLPVIR